MTAIAAVFVIVSLAITPASGEQVEKTIGVFVALADNESQGLVPVPKAIGNGEDPERNLYWGTAEGLQGVFDRSRNWRLTDKDDAPDNPDVLRTRTYRHTQGNATLTARAYRGTSIRKCLEDYEVAVAAGTYDLVVYIGHNGLMDFELPPTPAETVATARRSDAVVLCCKSETYFKSRIEAAGARPVLLTTQFMYPGAFLLEAAAEGWLLGEDAAKLRDRAGAAYATNQKISKKAATGVFAKPAS